jgi:hypothetical protein
MLAWPAKGKLVKLAKACFPPAASRAADRAPVGEALAATTSANMNRQS